MRRVLAALAVVATTLVGPSPAQATGHNGLEVTQDIYYYKCVTGTPPLCWHAGTLRFYVLIHLGYRAHVMRSKTAVVWGEPPRSEWFPKTIRVRCKVNKENPCGDWINLGTGGTWSDPRVYRPWRLVSSGYFTIRVYGCAKGKFCAAAATRSLVFRCKAADEQCLFYE